MSNQGIAKTTFGERAEFANMMEDFGVPPPVILAGIHHRRLRCEKRMEAVD